MDKFEFDFEKLIVYQKALDFIDKTFEIYKGLSQDHKISVGSNWVRAALSIANNIAEGNDKDSDKERMRYFAISSAFAGDPGLQSGEEGEEFKVTMVRLRRDSAKGLRRMNCCEAKGESTLAKQNSTSPKYFHVWAS